MTSTGSSQGSGSESDSAKMTDDAETKLDAESFEEESSLTPVDRILRDPATPKEIRQVMGAFLRMGPTAPPYLEKITEDHITRLINSGERDSERLHSERRWGYMFNVFCILCAVILFLVAMWFLVPTNPDMFLTVLGFLAGLGCGFGLGKSGSTKE